MKKETKQVDRKRILGRQLAKNLSIQELEKITGGTTSCSSGGADDCDTDII